MVHIHKHTHTLSPYMIYFTYFVTIETYEQFGEVLFMSAQKFKGTTAQVELTAETENGKQCFSELEVIAHHLRYTQH